MKLSQQLKNDIKCGGLTFLIFFVLFFVFAKIDNADMKNKDNHINISPVDRMIIEWDKPKPMNLYVSNQKKDSEK